MARILVIHGPNLNMLGDREPQHYGATDLETIDQRLADFAHRAGHELESFQSNAEHELVGRVQEARLAGTAFIIINPGAFTHTSIVLRDALLAVRIPFIEVHLSNVHSREPFRHKSYFSDIAIGVITGLGPESYELALRAALGRLG